MIFIIADHDDCLPDPCQNGAICQDQINDYTCECSPGWEGKNCEISNYLKIYNMTSMLVSLSTFS